MLMKCMVTGSVPDRCGRVYVETMNYRVSRREIACDANPRSCLLT